MADYKRDYDEPAARPTLRSRLELLEQAARDMAAAIEKLGNVLEQACREIGMDVQAFHD